MGTSPSPVPMDVIRRIARVLDTLSLYRTLSTLSLTSKDTYEVLSPLLFANLHVKGRLSDALFDITGLADALDIKEDIKLSTQAGTIFSISNSNLRRIATFQHVRHITIHSFPSQTSSSHFLDAVSRKSQSHWLPKLESVTLRPDAVDAIRTYTPETWDRPRNPPLLEALVKSSAPSHLCLSFRIVNYEDWEEHRDITTLGAYKLVARINQLRLDGWKSLTSLTIHDIVHQVLPSLPGCINTYHLAPHLLPSRHFLSGPASAGLAGPEWNFRAWQLCTAIKNLFPSGTDVRAALKGTEWKFVGVAGHVVTKPEHLNDEQGVTYGEVEGLVRDFVVDELRQDLPAREGFDREVVEAVVGKMKYEAEEQDCKACERCGTKGVMISTIRDIV